MRTVCSSCLTLTLTLALAGASPNAAAQSSRAPAPEHTLTRGVLGTEPLVDPRLKELDAWVRAHPEPFPNGVGIVLIQDGEVIFAKGYHGFLAERVEPIASSTKWISGLAIANAIVDEQIPQLTASTPIARFVPEFFESVGNDGSPDKRGITLAQAFSHTSGFPKNSEFPSYHLYWPATHEWAVGQISEIPLAGDPGGQIIYGGFGMHAAGLAVANALGTDWASFVDETLFTPLGMSRTDYDAFTDPDQAPTLNPSVPGGIRTTIEDYARFLMMLNLDGRVGLEQVIDPRAIELLTSDLADPATPIVSSPYTAYEPFVPGIGAYRTGFGCFIDPERVTPTGRARYATSAGLYGTNAFVDSDRRVTGVMFTFNDERGFYVDPETGARSSYNPSTRAFVEQIWPRIESGLDPFCGPGDVTTPAGVFNGDDVSAAVKGIVAADNPFYDFNRDGVIDFLDIFAYLDLASIGCRPIGS